MRRTITLLERHAEEIRSGVLPMNGHEGAAYILCGRADIGHDPWDGLATVRYCAREVVPLAPEDVLSSSPLHINLRTRTLTRVLRRAEETGAVAGFVHGHPGGLDCFSRQDDADEPHLIELAQNRNGPRTELLSLVVGQSGRMFGRVWVNKREAEPLSMLQSVGERFRLNFEGRESAGQGEELSRQALAFGPALNADLASLRIGVIGCGATGSAVAMLLARLGARRLLAVDDDHAERTNLGRLHGATAGDIDPSGGVGTPKVSIIKREIERLGLGVQVATHKGWVGSAEARDAIRSCDMLFGCTDDHDGRLFLNRVAYFYAIPLVDLGIGIDFVDDDPPRITHAEGRVTVVLPGTRCLLCRGVADPKLAQEDHLRRLNPEEYRRLRLEGEAYVRGAGRPNPAVVTFTTAAACSAVDELVQRLTGYRKIGSVPHRVTKHHLLEEMRPGPRTSYCPLCVGTSYWGRGDMTPFLDRIG